jgi:hypothetical protein
MKALRIVVVMAAIAGLSSVASGSIFMEDFESYASGSDLHGQGGWKGWDNTPGAGAPVSSVYAYSGSNSAEIVPAADLVHEFDVTGGLVILSAMQYIPSGTSGSTYFILLNTYSDGGAKDWSIQTVFNLDAGTISYWHGGEGQIVYDQWIELKYVIDLDNNTVDKYYNGAFIVTDTWDDNEHGTLQAIDLFGNNASSVYYDDIMIEEIAASNPDPANRAIDVKAAPVLTWSAPEDAWLYDLYLGTDADLVAAGDASVFQGQLTEASFAIDVNEPLSRGITYYWKVDVTTGTARASEFHPG